jgi:hypothetical protein
MKAGTYILGSLYDMFSCGGPSECSDFLRERYKEKVQWIKQHCPNAKVIMRSRKQGRTPKQLENFVKGRTIVYHLVVIFPNTGEEMLFKLRWGNDGD